jgi:DNA recombination protein RmuC
MLALFAVSALLAGLLLGFLLRSVTARTERNEFERRISELSATLNSAGVALTKSQEESAARAGFEALAREREHTIEQLKTEKTALAAGLQAKSDAESRAQARISELETELRKERESLGEKVKLLEDAKQALANQFQALAAEILEQKSKTFSEGSQKELNTLLEPLKAQIGEFRKKVEEAQTDSKTGVAELRGLVGILAEQSRQVGEQAQSLATALRGSAKAQGDWGEFILRDLLEKAGLREGEQYSFQQAFAGVEGEDGNARASRTDVILLMPGGRHLVIDSKVSLTAYTDYVNAADDAARAGALKQHLASVRGHVASLTKAGYQRLPGLESPDFVVMFVPVEPAFLAALQFDSALWADAYKEGILLVGPTTLLYIIRIVNVLWHQETQARNVKEVMERGARLYEKFVGFIGDMEEMGKSLRDASQSYEDARRKLSMGDGNLIRQVEMLRRLGVKPRKPLPARLLDTVEMETGELEPGLATDENGVGDLDSSGLDSPGLTLAAESTENG